MAFLLEASGISSRSARFGYMVLFGTLKTLTVIIAAPCFDSFGRRPMLLCSLTIMTLGLISIFSNLMMDSKFPALAIIGVVIYYVGFSIGVGPVCWLIPSEVRRCGEREERSDELKKHVYSISKLCCQLHHNF